MKIYIVASLVAAQVILGACASNTKFVNPIPFPPIAEPPVIEGVGFAIDKDKMRAKMTAEEIARSSLAAKIMTTVIRRSEVTVRDDTTFGFAMKSFTALPIPCIPHEQHLLRESNGRFEWWTSLTCALAEVDAARPQLQETFARLLKEGENKTATEIQETTKRVDDYRALQREIFIRSGFRPWVQVSPE